MSSFQHTPLEFLAGVGPQRAAALREEFGLSTVKDLLQHYPFRYIDRSDTVTIGALNTAADYIQIRGILGPLKEEGAGAAQRVLCTLITYQNGQVHEMPGCII